MKLRVLLAILAVCSIPSAAFASVDENVIFSRINAEREANGVLPLIENTELSQAALLKAEEIRRKGDLVHTETAPGTPWWPLASAGYQYASAGENLALSFEDASSMVGDWMDSPAHRANLLNSHFTEAGVAVVSADMGGHEAKFAVFYGGEPKEASSDLMRIQALLETLSVLVQQLSAAIALE